MISLRATVARELAIAAVAKDHPVRVALCDGSIVTWPDGRVVVDGATDAAGLFRQFHEPFVGGYVVEILRA